MAVSPTVRINVSGARGASFGDVARQTGSYDVEPTDNDAAVLEKFADAAILANPGFKGDKGDPGSPGEGYATRSALATAGNTATNGDDAYLTEGLRAGKFIFKTGNFSAAVTADPGQGIYIPKASDTSGATGAWVRQFDGPLFPEWFGAIGDGVTNDRTAIVNTRSAAIALGSDIAVTAGKDFYVGGTLTDISGVSLIPGKAARFSGNIDMEKDIRPRDGSLQIDVDSSGVKYTTWVRPERPFAQRSLRLTEGDLKRLSGIRVSPSGLGMMTFEQVAWPAGDAWSASTPASTTADAWEANASSGATWYGAFRRAKAGQTMRATFEAGSYLRGIIVRWSGGYVILYGQGTSAQVSIKSNGVAVSTATVSWPGQSDHPQWSLDNAELGIRVYDLTTVGFVVNGYEVYRGTVQGIIHDVGYGVFANGSAVTPAISWISETIEDSFGGEPSLTFSVYGDSISAPFASGATSGVFAGSWVDSFREAIDRSPQGVKVTGWNNYAVPSHNSADLVALFDTHGVGASNYIVLFIGTNDVQGGSALSASVGNLTYVLGEIRDAGRKAVVVIPPLWLNADQGAEGFTSANGEKAAPLRAAFRSLALQFGALLVDLSQLTGQVLTAYYESSALSDPAMRDRIHPTAFLYEAIGHEIASVVLGDIGRKVTAALAPSAVPSAWLRNGWAMTTEPPHVQISESGFVSFFGVLDAGTKADGTIIMVLPPSLRCPYTRRFLVNASSTLAVRIQIATNGEATIFGVQSGDSYIVLDGIEFQL